MPAKGTKWCVNNAVQDSALPPPARLIMLVLSDMADARTGEIPAKQTPSVSELVRRTGLKETTVKTHRAALERLGWVVIVRPTAAEAARHIPSRYRIAIGKDPTGGRETTPGGGREATLESATRGSGDDPRIGGRGSGDDPPGAVRRPPRGSGDDPLPITYDHNDQDDQELAAGAADADASDALFDAPPTKSSVSRSSKPRSGGKPKPADPEIEARNKLAVDITRTWWDGCSTQPSGKFIGRQQIVYGLLEAGHAPDAVAEALRRCDFSMTRAAVELQLKRMREQAEREASNPTHGLGPSVIPGQYGGNVTPLRPRPSTTDQRVATGLALAAYYRERGE